MSNGHWCVLTEAVPLGGRNRAICIARRLRWRKFDGLDLGHPGVTRSLTRGLRQLGTAFSLNPISLRRVGPICVVLSSIGALKQAIEWKRKGDIRVLLAGPNLMVRSNEHGGILAAPEVDVCLVPSDWVGTAYVEDAPALAGRIQSWYAGVDVHYWAPEGRPEKRRNALVYWKNADASLLLFVEARLKQAGWPVVRMKYGHYSQAQYRAALAEAAFAVFLSPSESQGIALAEAWAMDVATVVWQPLELIIDGRLYTTFSASPYLNPQVGVRWTSEDDFERVLAAVPEMLTRFSPRAWVTENMTDLHAARKIADLVRELQRKRPAHYADADVVRTEE